MVLYLFLLLIPSVVLVVLKKNENKERISLFVTCFVVFLLLALRSKDSGCDLNAYASMYEDLKGVGFGEVLKSFCLFGKSEILGVEWGYTLFTWVLYKVGFGFQALLAIQSAFCVFSICHFVDKYSTKPSLSIVIVIAFGVVDYFYCILRQSMAFAVILFSVEFWEKKKHVVSMLMFLISVSFHRSIALFCVVFPLSFLPINWYTSIAWIAISVLIITLFTLFNRLFIEGFMVRFGGSYLSKGFEFGELVVVIIAIALFTTFFYSRKEEISRIDRLVFWAFMMCVPLEFVAMYIPVMGRLLTLCFMPFSSIAITNSFIRENEEMDKVSISLSVLIFLAVFAYYAFCLYFDKRLLGIVPYKLFFVA